MRNFNAIESLQLKACGQWRTIFYSLSIEVPDNPKVHAPCPACGGKDRFRFDDIEGRGTWICNQCGAGDGFALIKNVFQCDMFEATQKVANILNLGFSESIKKASKSASTQNKNIAEKVNALLAKCQIKESDYLKAKGLNGYHYSVLSDGQLVLSLLNIDGEIAGAQLITTDGHKKLLSGTQKTGSFIPVNGPEYAHQRIILAEGLATALSISLIQPEAYIVAAIDAGNLLHVAKIMRERYPDSMIIIAGDNDIKAGHKNTGKEKAIEATKVVGGYYSIPDTDFKCDWDDYRQQYDLQKTSVSFNENLTKVNTENLTKPNIQNPAKPNISSMNLAQMAASQRGKVLAEHYGEIVVNPESESVYVFTGSVWEKVSDNELRRTMGSIFDNHETPYSPKGIDSAIDAMKLQIPVIGQQKSELIGFENGVYNLSTNQFSAHHPDNWLMNHNGITFTQPVANENLKDHAPHFHKWLTHSAGNDKQKAERIKAALFMNLANRYDWQLFIEVTGEGGSGKSIFTAIATILAGEHNTASGNMIALDNARGRAQFVGKRLITLPDQTRYVGEGAGIKAITGGDLVEIDGKYEKQFSIILQTVVLATNNEPMTFTERNGGIARRRVIFPFNIPVSDKDKDPDLMVKVRREIPVVIRHLLSIFSNQNKAKALLIEQRESAEALEVKRGTDPVIDLCASIYFMEEAKGLMMGGGSYVRPEPRSYLYHLYLAFLEYHGLGKPLSVEKFSRAMKNAAKEYRSEYLTRKVKGRTQTNVRLTELSDEFIPHVAGIYPTDDTPLGEKFVG